ncbi:XRE family transcriptional regulator [Xanthovirga aplysinae]|uniref:XRE family transcriptional regulator n=1 Tax=Xanthovirga aplysinae TaxID=2529853 RepID=UPI0012BCCDB1|nr:LexA family transcriptional regulator [Xanthovirga aplysinae]MTI30927.1 helix-turn-helix domain-containing protein [Xanthovirga aplysinae]
MADISTIGGRIALIRKENGFTQYDIAHKTGYKRSSIAAIESNNQNPPIDFLTKFVKICNTSYSVILEGKEGGDDLTNNKSENSHDGLLTITVDQYGEENIVLVDTKAAAGYADRLIDPEFYRELPAFTLPSQRFRNGTFRAFEISGDSMMPRIANGDLVIGELLDNWATDIIDGYIHIVVLKDDLVCKRVLNRISERGRLRLKSDNPAYSDYEVYAEDVVQVFKYKCVISFDGSNPNFDLQSSFNKLENEIFDLKQQFELMKKRK